MVRAQHVGDRIAGDARADRRIGAGIDQERAGQGEDFAIVVETDLDVVNIVARMRRVEDVFVAVLDPLDRAAQFASQPGDENVFRVDMPLAAETAADIGRDAAHALFGHAERGGDLAPDPMDDLGRRPDCQRIGAGVVIGDHAPAFHRHRGVAMMDETAFEPVRGGIEPVGAGALLGVQEGRHVAPEMVVDQRCAVCQRRFGIG